MQLLSELTEVFRGRTPGKIDYEFEKSSRYKVIKCNHMDWEGCYSGLEDIKEEWGFLYKDFKLQSGDILISCIGSGSIRKVVR